MERILAALFALGLCAKDASTEVVQGVLKIFYAARGGLPPSLSTTAGGEELDIEQVLKDLRTPSQSTGGPLSTAGGSSGSERAAPERAAPERTQEILSAVRIASGIPDAERFQLAQSLIADPHCTVAAALQRIQARQAELAAPSGAGHVAGGDSVREKFTTQARDAVLLATWGGNLPKEIVHSRSGEEERVTFAPQQGNFGLRSLMRLAEECVCVAGANRSRVRDLPRQQLAKLAMGLMQPYEAAQLGIFASSDGAAYNTSGMFSNILLDAANVVARRSYDEARTTFQIWMGMGPDLTDFRPVHKVIAGELNDPKAVPEDGEFEESTMLDAKESYKLTVWGIIFSLTWQTVVNDALGEFMKIPLKQGAAMRRKQNKLAYAVLKDNAVMADGGALFNTTAETTAGGHNNQDGSGAAPTVAELNAGFQRMVQHFGLSPSEETTLGIEPRYLIHPPALRGTVKTLLSSMADPAGAHAGVENIWRNELLPISEPQLGAAVSGGSDAKWYLAASVDQVDTIEYAYLQGLRSPALESQASFSHLAVKYRIYQAFAVAAIDWRGLDYNPGA